MYNYNDAILKRREELVRIHILVLREYMYGGREKIFRVDQPRVPRGNPDGGEWTRIGLPQALHYRNPRGRGLTRVGLPFLLIIGAAGGLLARSWKLWASSAALRAAMGWSLGSFKSMTRWANQIVKRNWTPEQITEVIRSGEKFPAPNKVNPGNTATRYQDRRSGRFVVQDDVTKEILQVSGDEKFMPN